MKKYLKILTVVFLTLVFLNSAVAENKVRAYTCLTGGTTGCLDKLSVSAYTDGDISLVVGPNNNSYTYVFVAAATDAESSPWYIRPDDYSSAGVNYLIGTAKMETVVDSTATTYNVNVIQARVGTVFWNTYAGTKTFVMPAAEANMAVCIRNSQGVSQILRADTDGTDYIVKPDGSRTTAAGDYYGATASASNQLCLATGDSTDWYVTSEVGTWSEE